MRQYTTSLATGKIKIKTTLIFCLTPAKIVFILNKSNNNGGKVVFGGESLYIMEEDIS